VNHRFKGRGTSTEEDGYPDESLVADHSHLDHGSVLQRLDKRHHPLLDEMDMIYRGIRL
jgi:hypothetical protein